MRISSVQGPRRPRSMNRPSTGWQSFSLQEDSPSGLRSVLYQEWNASWPRLVWPSPELTQSSQTAATHKSGRARIPASILMGKLQHSRLAATDNSTGGGVGGLRPARG